MLANNDEGATSVPFGDGNMCSTNTLPHDTTGTDDFEQAIRDVWRQLAHSLMRNHAVFQAFGQAISAPSVTASGRLARSAESYEWEENRAHIQTTEKLEEMLHRAGQPDQSSALAVLWRAVNELEHIAECGQRGWMLAIRESEGRFSLGSEAREEIGKLSRRLEELFYWTLESMRLCYSRIPDQQMRDAGRIVGKEASVALKVLEKTAAECKDAHETRNRDGRCAIPGGVAFLDYIATMSRAGEHLSVLLDLTGSREQSGDDQKDAVHCGYEASK